MKIKLPQDILDATIEAMEDYRHRLELEAAALAGLDGPAAKQLAEQRAKLAETAAELANFYLHL